jgi:hypothetical protein
VKAETLRRETRQWRLLDGIPFRARNLLFYSGRSQTRDRPIVFPSHQPGYDRRFFRLIRQISSMFAAGDRSFEDAGRLIIRTHFYIAGIEYSKAAAPAIRPPAPGLTIHKVLRANFRIILRLRGESCF